MRDIFALLCFCRNPECIMCYKKIGSDTADALETQRIEEYISSKRKVA